VPLPENLADFIHDRGKAIALGKALFWDAQVGSDGKTACATCHWHAGADVRTQNTLHPGAPGSAFGPQTAEARKLAAAALSNFRGPNQTLKAEDFPFHRLKNPIQPGDYPGDANPDNPVIYDKPEVAGSQGVIAKNFLSIVEGSPVDAGVIRIDPVFQAHGANLRQVTGRNTPTSINAVFFDRSFWDGRANRYFNGVNEFGDLDPNAKVLKANPRGDLEAVRILLDNAALASQAVGPVDSPVEMSWLARSFPEVGRKMFSLRPLATQKIAADDSVLGTLRHSSGRGLDPSNAGYAALIRAAFKPEWWSSNKLTADGYTQMEANFSLFWGLSIMLYEATLVSDQTPYDRYAHGDSTALSPKAKEGLKLFLGAGKCINCHGGPEFAGATVSKLRGVLHNDGVIEFMPMEKGTAYYDGGFYNIGVRPTQEDLGLGANHPLFGPLSYSRQEQAGKNPEPKITIRGDARIAADGAFKTPTLRNIELTGPYMHNGGMKSLEEVMQFYTRGADFLHPNINDIDPDVDGIPELQGNPEAISAVVEFLQHLTDPRVKYQAAPFDHPELLLPNGHEPSSNSTAPDKLVRLPETGKGGGAPLGTFEDALKYGLQLDQGYPGHAEEVLAEEPVAEEPAIAPPVEEPVAEEPAIAPPVEEPVAEEPAVADPAEEPAAEEPAHTDPAEEPAAEEPAHTDPAEEPAAEEPAHTDPAEEPAAEEPAHTDPADDPADKGDKTDKESAKPAKKGDKADKTPARPASKANKVDKAPAKPADKGDKAPAKSAEKGNQVDKEPTKSSEKDGKTVKAPQSGSESQSVKRQVEERRSGLSISQSQRKN
jgi:cytochrome c peroxidase